MEKSKGKEIAVRPISVDPGKSSPILEQAKAKVVALRDELKSVKVVDEASLQVAMNIKGSARDSRKALEGHRIAQFGAVKREIKKAEGEYQSIETELSAIEDGVTESSKTYLTEKARKANEAARKEQERLNREHAKAVAKAEKKGEEAPAPAPTVQAAKVTGSFAGGIAKAREIWDFDVVNIQQVPGEFLEIRRGDVLRRLANMEGEGRIVAPAIGAKAVTVPDLPGITAYKKVSL